MTRAERYLEREAEFQRRHWEENPPSRPRTLFTDWQTVALRDAPSAFLEKLNEIINRSNENEESHLKLVCESRDLIVSDTLDLKAKASSNFTATIVGSSQQGKTTMLNSLLNLFGFEFIGQTVFLDEDLLPTNAKNGAGLPFPVRLQYHNNYEVVAEQWSAEELEALVQIVVDKELDENPDFFEDVEQGLVEPEKGSFLEFVAKHCRMDKEGNCACKPSAAAVLTADGDYALHTFGNMRNAHEAAFSFLLGMATQQWFRYRRVTLRCPSLLLKKMTVGCQTAVHPSIVDLPGVGIDSNNNSLVEELVFREVSQADTIIVLTGPRTFTQDVLRVLRSSVFERVLDPTVVPPPTVAVTNSHHLVGMQPEEMEQWKDCTLHGELGWYKALQAFADDSFSDQRRHRSLSDLEPSLFPHDLRGILEAGPDAQDVGVAFLVGYLMRLPQESSVALVNSVLEMGNDYRSTVENLGQVAMIGNRKSASTFRLAKQAMENRKEEFQLALASKLTNSLQQEMFRWEQPKSLQEQINEMEATTEKELNRLQKRFFTLKDDRAQMKQQIPQLLKQVSLDTATNWDNSTGRVVFERFSKAALVLASEIYMEWVPKLFIEDSRSGDVDPNVNKAREVLLNILNTEVPKAISTIQYTLTDSFCQQVRNLDTKELFKFCRGRSSGVTHEHLWRDIQVMVAKKTFALRELVQKHHAHQSHQVKELVVRLKNLITQTFDKRVKIFETVTSAIEQQSKGQSSSSQDPAVILQRDLLEFANQINRYLETHRKTRDQFGAEELKIVQRARSARNKVHARPEPLSESASKRPRS